MHYVALLFLALMFITPVILVLDMLYLAVSDLNEYKVLKTTKTKGKVIDLFKRERKAPYFVFMLSPAMWAAAKATEATHHYATVRVDGKKVSQILLSEKEFKSLSKGQTVQLTEELVESTEHIPLFGMLLMDQFKRKVVDKKHLYKLVSHEEK